MVYLKGSKFISQKWLVLSSLLLLLCLHFVQSGVEKIELPKTANQFDEKNSGAKEQQTSLAVLETTTSLTLTLNSSEDDDKISSKDLKSTTIQDNEDVPTSVTSPSEAAAIYSASSSSQTDASRKDKRTITSSYIDDEPVPCTCGIFLTSQFTKGSQQPLKGQEAIISNFVSRKFSCDGVGRRHCQTKCLEQIVQHLPNSGNLLCASVDRDIRKEKAYLFIKNCEDKWINTNLAAGREYCCRNRKPYNCKMGY